MKDSIVFAHLRSAASHVPHVVFVFCEANGVGDDVPSAKRRQLDAEAAKDDQKVDPGEVLVLSDIVGHMLIDQFQVFLGDKAHANCASSTDAFTMENAYDYNMARIEKKADVYASVFVRGVGEVANFARRYEEDALRAQEEFFHAMLERIADHTVDDIGRERGQLVRSILAAAPTLLSRVIRALDDGKFGDVVSTKHVFVHGDLDDLLLSRFVRCDAKGFFDIVKRGFVSVTHVCCVSLRADRCSAAVCTQTAMEPARTASRGLQSTSSNWLSMAPRSRSSKPRRHRLPCVQETSPCHGKAPNSALSRRGCVTSTRGASVGSPSTKSSENTRKWKLTWHSVSSARTPKHWNASVRTAPACCRRF